jgi:hypothetical protein
MQLAEASAAITAQVSTRVSNISREQSRQVVQALSNTVGSALQSALASALPEQISSPGMQAALQRALAPTVSSAVGSAVSSQLATKFQEQFAGVIVPGFQAAVRDMFRQIELAYSGWLAEQSQHLAGITSEVGACCPGKAAGRVPGIKAWRSDGELGPRAPAVSGDMLARARIAWLGAG